MKLNFLFISLFIVGVGLIAGVSNVGAVISQPSSDPRYIAHRGYSAKYCDNTAEAFEAAASMRFYGIETDIHVTADGKYVCNHDATVKYADGDEKTIVTSTLAELTAKPLLNDKTAEPAYLCTFEDYLTICASGNKQAYVELKASFTDDQIAEILGVVDEKYDRKKVTFISFDYGLLLRVGQADPTLSREYLSQTKNDPLFANCLEEGISIDVKYDVLTSALVKEFHAKGLTMNTWTVDKRFYRMMVAKKQVDFITTNVFEK